MSELASEPAVKRIDSGGAWEQRYGYSRAIAVGPWVLTSGCTSTVDGLVAHAGDAYLQARQAFRIALDSLVDLGVGVGDVVRTRMYVVGPEHSEAVGKAHGELFGVVRPVTTIVYVARLLHPDHLVEVELEAYKEDTGAG